MTFHALTCYRQTSVASNDRRLGCTHSIDRYESLQDEPLNTSELRSIPSNKMTELPARDNVPAEANCQRPDVNRASTFEGSILRQEQPWQSPRASENHSGRIAHSQIRPVNRVSSDPYAPSPEAGPFRDTSPDYIHRGRSVSPATSHRSAISRAESSNTTSGASMNKRAPPPPPPRSKKPPPPPPPMVKKSLVGAGDA